MNQYFNDELGLFHTKVNFDTSEENSCCIFNMAIFSKFFGDIMSQIIKQNAGKKIKYFLEFSFIKIFNLLESYFLRTGL